MSAVHIILSIRYRYFNIIAPLGSIIFGNFKNTILRKNKQKFQVPQILKEFTKFSVLISQRILITDILQNCYTLFYYSKYIYQK